MIYAFDRCFFIKNSDEKSAKKVLGERLYTNKRIKLDFSYDIVEENDDFVTRKIIDDYCKASKEIASLCIRIIRQSHTISISVSCLQ